MVERIPVVVVGAGHAGLTLSYELGRAQVDHVILERARIGQAWRTRWDSFCIVTPNWTLRLPGGAYDGDSPDAFMPRDQLVTFLESYATSFGAPVREGVNVSSVEPGPKAGFLLRTSDGDIEADSVVLASGGYQKPYRPRAAASLPPHVLAIDAEGYRAPGALPPGKILVVGSGQTGCQIAEELHEAGRDVVLACGRAAWLPRRIEGRDIVSWVLETPFLHQTLGDLPSPAARLLANFQTSGRDGGHDLHYRTLARMGVTLAGHLVDVEDDHALFADDLRESIAFGDARHEDIFELIRKTCRERGEAVPELPPPEPIEVDPPLRLDLTGCSAVVFTSGFRPDFTSWIHLPSAFDEDGFPLQVDGESTVVPGLFFMGVHFMRKRMSATFLGAGEDAAVVAERVVRYRSAPV